MNDNNIKEKVNNNLDNKDEIQNEGDLVKNNDENNKNETIEQQSEIADNKLNEDKEEKHIKKQKLTKEELEKALKEMEEKYNSMNEQFKELNDRYIRLYADFDNYRKRVLKEKIELSKQAGEQFFKGLLPIIDDFERGIKNIENTESFDSMKEGMMLIYKKFKDFLERNGVKEIEINNGEFNADFHEAVTTITAPSEELKGKIIDVLEKGYMYNDKILRFAKVVVGE